MVAIRGINVKGEVNMKAKNGDGYVEKTKSGKYACTIVSTCTDPVTGNYKKIKRTKATRDEAITAAKQAVRAYEKEWREKNNFKDGLTLTFGEACEEYLQKKVKGEVTGSTFYTYYRSYKQFIDGYKTIRNTQIRNLSKRSFELLYGTWAEKYSPKSIEYPVQLCRQVCKWLMERALIPENYAEQCKPKYEIPDDIETLKKLEHKKILSQEDLAKIYNAYKANLKSDYICVVLFLCETGLRPQEFACLQNSDIDKERKCVSVNKTCARRYVDDEHKKSELYVKITKTGESREVMLSPLALEMIEQMQLKTQAYCKNNKDDLLYPIFSNGRIRTNATMEVGFKHLCEMLDIDRDVHATRGGQKIGINLYACRHTCETMMEVNGISPIIIGAMLGHSPEVGLKHYTHISLEDVQKQAKTPFMLMGDDEEKEVKEKADEVDSLGLSEEQEIAVLKVLLEKYKDKL